MFHNLFTYEGYQMFRQNPQGFHTSLTPQMHAKIIECVPRVLMPKQVAKLAKIHPDTILNWLKRGMDDVKSETGTVFAQLFLDYQEKLGEEVEKLISKMQICNKYWQAAYELLKVAAREDFGHDTEEYKELLEMYTRLFESHERLAQNKLQGVINHGKALDSSSDQTPRRIEKEITREEREENTSEET